MGELKIQQRARSMMPIVVILLFAAIVLGIFLRKNSLQPVEVTSENNAKTCDSADFKTAYYSAELYLSSKANQLQILVDEIKQYKNYQANPNCMHAVVLLSLNNGDVEQVKSIFDVFNAAYTASSGFSGELKGANLQTPDDLRPVIERLTATTPYTNVQPFDGPKLEEFQ